MTLECDCGNDIAPRRAALGINTCLDCGEAAAKQKTANMRRMTFTMHKSNTVYVGDGAAARERILEIARMRGGRQPQ